MKLYLPVLVFISLTTLSCFVKLVRSIARIPAVDNYDSPKQYPDSVINALKNTKTVFFYGTESGKRLDSLETAISSAWDLTPLVFDSYNNRSQYIYDNAYSYFVIQGGEVVNNMTYTNTNSASGPSIRSMEISNTHYYIVLHVLFQGNLCRIELSPDSKTLLPKDNENQDISALYNKGYFYNWTPVNLKAQLQQVNQNLKNHMRPDLFKVIKTENVRQLLANDTLYIPADYLVKYNMFSGHEKDKSENIFKAYKFPYRICSNSELFDIFITHERGRFLFEYVKSSTFKFVTIYDLKDKKIIYKANSSGYNLREGDLSKIK